MPSPKRRTSAGEKRRNHGTEQALQLAQDSDTLQPLEAVAIAEVPSFDELRQLLLTAHAAAEHHHGQAVRAAVVAGRVLLEVQARLKGTGASFADWCEDAGIPRRTAYRYRAVALRAADRALPEGATITAAAGDAPQVVLKATVPATVRARFGAAAEARGMKAPQLLAQIIDDWLARNEGVIDV